jgi:cytochrome c-type biogenesis protein CcmH/NrfG
LIGRQTSYNRSAPEVTDSEQQAASRSAPKGTGRQQSSARKMMQSRATPLRRHVIYLLIGMVVLLMLTATAKQSAGDLNKALIEANEKAKKQQEAKVKEMQKQIVEFTNRLHANASDPFIHYRLGQMHLETPNYLKALYHLEKAELLKEDMHGPKVGLSFCGFFWLRGRNNSKRRNSALR